MSYEELDYGERWEVANGHKCASLPKHVIDSIRKGASEAQAPQEPAPSPIPTKREVMREGEDLSQLFTPEHDVIQVGKAKKAFESMVNHVLAKMTPLATEIATMLLLELPEEVESLRSAHQDALHYERMVVQWQSQGVPAQEEHAQEKGLPLATPRMVHVECAPPSPGTVVPLEKSRSSSVPVSSTTVLETLRTADNDATVVPGPYGARSEASLKEKLGDVAVEAIKDGMASIAAASAKRAQQQAAPTTFNHIYC